uniref:Uncharacterized protein n=1 Tax=Meloidogyne javanica TaxID=6303 RepID=A0A915M8T8_MELJA
MSGEKPNYEHVGYKTDKIVAEEYVQKLVGTNRYFLPEAIDADIFCYEEIDEGKLMKEENPEMSKEETVGEDNQSPKNFKRCKFITSKDNTVAKMFEYLYLKIDKVGVREQLEKILLPADKCNIGFPLPKNIFGKAFLLDSALTFSEEDLEELVHGEEKMSQEVPDEDFVSINIKDIQKMEEAGNIKLNDKLKDEIDGKVNSISNSMMEQLDKLETLEEKEDKIKEWNKMLDDWEEKARRIFYEKIKVEKDEESHKKLTEQKVHPFRFLQEINFGVSVKPSDKRFKNISGEEYEEMIEFFKNPKEFIILQEEITAEKAEENKWKRKLNLLAIDGEIKNCYELKDPLIKVLQYEGIDDPIHQEFRG